MNLYKKITDAIAKVATAISMLAVLVMVFFIVMELIPPSSGWPLWASSRCIMSGGLCAWTF